eukprot:TRINITY_DN4619_c0_g1_i1.p1 TRINITY_DN4619_c0_g1~~TRINITY_DN4619_c0_g1_i1.p1  ORF type:complete len:340 (-),score=64.18 TRINITY_DN4619_c0_g1_i1:123-1142(-)
MANRDDDPLPKSLRELMAAPKGRIDYISGYAFLLHVFWEAPSAAAASRLLAGLQQCATATHRDTPCVPTYFFRISQNNTPFCSPPPRTVGDHPPLRQALRKLQVGIPAPAVRAELAKRGLDPELVNLAPDAELPADLQTQPVALEFTEIYLDERAFMQHAGSRDYLDGHAVVMNPAMHYIVPSTVRLGTPPASLIESCLEPILREIVAPLPEGCHVWRTPPMTDQNAMFLSLDVDSDSPASVAAALPSAFREHCTTCLVFAHPLRAGLRVMCVLPTLPPALPELSALPIVRGEAFVQCDEAVGTVRAALEAAGLGVVSVNATQAVGHVLHPRAAELRSN